MKGKKTFKIFKIKHKELDEEDYIIAEDASEAIEKFVNFYRAEYYFKIQADGIESVTTFFNEEVIN